MTRVIHTGDTHIGYRQYHSPDRQRDFIRAFDSVVTDAIETDVAALVHAGDLFHDSSPGLDTLMETVSILRRLSDADIPFLGIVGNHEAKRDRQWLDLFADLGLATRLDSEGTVVGAVTLYGLDWVPPTHRDGLSLTFDPPTTEWSALVAHGLFEPFAHAEWDTSAVLDTASIDFDALLLGDNHTPDRATVDDTWVTYCGSTERTSAAEEANRGYNLVTFGDELRIARKPVSETREFVFVDVELAPEEGEERIIDAVRSRSVTDAVVIVRVSGRGRDIAPARVEEAVTDAGALVTRVIDHRDVGDETTPDVSFADPDRAVDDRIRSLPLSEAGRLIDTVVRDDSIPDTAVRDRIEHRLGTLLEEVPTAFEPGSEKAAPDKDDQTSSTSSESDREGLERTEPRPASEPVQQTSIGEF